MQTWVGEHLPGNFCDAVAPGSLALLADIDAEAAAAWYAALGERGYTVPHWPREHGGPATASNRPRWSDRYSVEQGAGLPDHYLSR